MAVSRNQNAGQNRETKMRNTPFERVEQFSVWEQPQETKIPFTKKLIADRIQGMFAINRCRIFCFAVRYQKISTEIKTHGTIILSVTSLMV
jgi:hypothetical protein